MLLALDARKRRMLYNSGPAREPFLAGGNCHSGQEDLSILVADDVMTHLLRKGSDV